MKDRALSRIVIDSGTDLIYVNGQCLKLTLQQFDIFAYLWRKKTVATYEQLFQAFYGSRLACDQPVREGNRGNLPVFKTQICRMRPKLARFGIAIVTTWGVGCRLEYHPPNVKRTHLAPQPIMAAAISCGL